LRRKTDERKARDEGRSSDYEAKERNEARAAFRRNPRGRGLSRHGQRSLGCGSGSMSAPFTVFLAAACAHSRSTLRESESGALEDIMRCRSSLVWHPPNGAPRFAPAALKANRRAHAGLNQRFLRCW